MNKGRNIAITMICILLGVILSLQYKSTAEIKKTDALSYQRIQDVQNELFSEREKIDNLKKQLEEKDKTIMKYEAAIARDKGEYEVLNDSLEQARLFAGLKKVTGKGVEVRVEESPGGEVHFEDILELLNVLRAAGAQALSVNNERVIATTEIINAGGYIAINGNRYKAPFTVKAIGKPDVLESSLRMKGGIVDTLKQYFLRVDIKRMDELEIPQFNGVINIDQLRQVK